MNELTGTDTTIVDGTDWISVSGTESGTFVHKTITADVDEAIVISSVDGNEETHEIGTTTIDEEAHDVGTTTVFGTYTNDETGTLTMAVLGTV
jgi:folate-binding Fe-S cluster repair protein YgfZ